MKIPTPIYTILKSVAVGVELLASFASRILQLNDLNFPFTIRYTINYLDKHIPLYYDYLDKHIPLYYVKVRGSLTFSVVYTGRKRRELLV